MPNALGIYDMGGNISEWCWDLFNAYKTINTAVGNNNNINPRIGGGGTFDGSELRVRRGGAWSNAAANVRSVVRNSDTAKTSTWVNGFRVVRGPSEIW